MDKTNNNNPRTIEECNLAISAITSELVNRMKFDSKVLICGQADLLTLSEYEALFQADMKICEDALDIVLSLARKQKAYLEAMVAFKRLEKSLPEAIADTFAKLSVRNNNARELRKRVVGGDFSFFISSNVTENNAISSIQDSTDSCVTVSNSTTNAAENNHCSSHSFFSKIHLNSDCFVPSISSYPIRERPQYSSEVARRLLEEMELMDQQKVFSSLRTQLDQCDNFRPYSECSFDRQGDEKNACKYTQSSGSSNLDGSLIMDDEEESGQNGIRIYSPITNVPSQPNFDETGMESLCEPLLIPKVLSDIRNCPIEKAYHQIIRPEPLRLTNRPEVALKSTENLQTRKLEDDVKTHEYSWMSTPVEGKVAASIQRAYNQE